MPTKLFLILAGVLWGTGGLSGALLQNLAGLHPLAVATYRLLLGGAIATLALAVQIRRLRFTKEVVRRLLAAGALLALFQASYFGGVAMTSVSLATLVTIGSSPVILAIFTAVRSRRLPGLRTSLCVVLAVVGLALLAGTPSTRDVWHTVFGIVLCLVAASGFATFTVINRVPVLPAGPTISLGLLIGGLVLLPFALPLGMALPLRPDVLLTALFLGLVPTAVAYGVYLIGLRGASAVAAALAAVLEPLTATVLSVAFFAESLGIVGVVGAVLLGLALVVNYSAESGSAQGEPSLPAGRPGAGVGS
ncbi:DMT family transporter [Kibdelosporangium persicum]|uniref:Permease of the drug/metabolite transporter (DMT) superfamily n=1 Tax=Kibdelosporangium persicum TaxID=2698649 RepID=A0ABX2FFC3_9PSEU|nr:EamA family transporter [Kibdelosporangium persicum]NRN70088.1 Permease of the drug/metabolite transporter (DMT) superfamily [Kibdelosporangium persicum]